MDPNTSERECMASESIAIDFPNIPANNFNILKTMLSTILTVDTFTAVFTTTPGQEVFSSSNNR